MPAPGRSSAGGSAQLPMPGPRTGGPRSPSGKRDGAGPSQRPRFQYLSIKYTERLAEAGIEPSVGSIGDSYEFKLVRASGSDDPGDHPKAQNALAETINGLCKAEVIHRRGPWRNFEAAEYATLEWVDWFNNRRLLEPIGSIPPAEAEANFYAALEPDDMAAQLSQSGLRQTRGVCGCPGAAPGWPPSPVPAGRRAARPAPGRGCRSGHWKRRSGWASVGAHAGLPHGRGLAAHIGERDSFREFRCLVRWPATSRYRTTNWAAYNASLKRRGSLSIRFDPDMSQQADRSGKRGDPGTFSERGGPGHDPGDPVPGECDPDLSHAEGPAPPDRRPGRKPDRDGRAGLARARPCGAVPAANRRRATGRNGIMAAARVMAPSAVTVAISSSAGIWASRSCSIGASPTLLDVTSMARTSNVSSSIPRWILRRERAAPPVRADPRTRRFEPPCLRVCHSPSPSTLMPVLSTGR